MTNKPAELAHLAERVMGLRRSGNELVDSEGTVVCLFGDWRPHTSIADAVECVEKWRKVNERSRKWNIWSPNSEMDIFEVRLVIGTKGEVTFFQGHESLPAAITAALLKATGYEEETR